MNSFPRPAPSPNARSSGVVAVLGPTNTGKTHYAIERMLAHGSGIIGLPLRLLAREVYGKIVERAGEKAVALVTGEEKIKPDAPRYWVCTVEAMPRDLVVDFVAIDEIQIAADRERGHVFTDRVLRHRGLHETLLLGAETMRGIVQRLVPGARISTRPRLSRLSHAGEKKITRLPPRSAVVAFSADEVYAIAELIRRQRGGAAVVLGALSPRTRNAQVELYQSGDVDFLVATDAIGMGLNLDVEHVAFAADRKFDGVGFRRLTAAEMGQIAGRAGRHMRDGTFGVTARVAPLEPELIERLENHDFEPERLLQWRNPELDFSSIAALIASLSASPEEMGLARARIGTDQEVLEAAARDPDIRAMATIRADVARLWEAAQIPDYRKVSPATHIELCLDVFRHLRTRGRIPDDWFVRHVKQADRVDGDIDTLSTRIAHMRSWAFMANRPDWLDDPDHWRETTRALEDKLSDALHQRLTQRFVDRRTSVLIRRLREKAVMEAQINEAGDVLIEDQPVGRLQGFQFTPDATAEAAHGKALRAAASKALTAAIQARAERVAEAGNEAFVLASNGGIRWMGEEIARLAAGDVELEPRVRLLADELLVPPQRDWVQARLEVWARHHVGTLLKPLFDLRAGIGLEGIARGIAFRLVEDLGILERAKVAEEVKGLDQAARAALRAIGVRFGAHHLFVPATMKPKPRELAAQLWALKHGGLSPEALREVPQLAGAGRTSIPVNKELPRQLYRVLGYKVLGERAVRVDILERLADLIRPLIGFRVGQTPGMPPKGAADGDGFSVTVEMTSLLGCSGEDFAGILRGLGYRAHPRSLAEHETLLAAARAKAEAEAPAPFPAPEAPAGEDATPSEAGTDGTSTDETVSEPAAAAEPPTTEAVAAEAPTSAPETPPEPPPVADAMPPQAQSETTTVEGSAAALEPTPPATIDIWRPQRFERRDGARKFPTRDSRRGDGGERKEGSSRPDRPPRRAEGPRRSEDPRPEAASAEPPKEPRPPRERPRRPKFDFKPGTKSERSPERDRSRPGHRPDRDRDRERAPRVFSSDEGRRSGPDPDSPFAKLAALKARMEDGDKS